MKYPDFNGASCAGIGIEFFFEDEETGRFPNVRSAKIICASCPVQKACTDWGLKHEKYGIWGGLTPDERNKIRKAQNIILVDPKHQAGLGYKTRMDI